MKIILILILLAGTSAFCQEVSENEDCTTRYAKLEQVWLEYSEIPAVTKAGKLWRSFHDKLTNAYIPTVDHGDDRLRWLEKNLKKTKFKSFEEGKREYEAMINAEKDVAGDPRIIAIRADFEKAYKQCGYKHYTEFIINFKKKYPNKLYP
ncbi:hypothetical protein LRS05_07125 [Flavobacterium sp. J372]|uniref:hypothetical protein n=1 Tax=Flavobacterium sp. J372 TaxID=2898436 RepID=UPI0021511889|nr:hypothetical protein [Flavobacterium sp. J372]MCR5861920.1 hypothetical protein [Flavobacterium sp. J372]